MPGYSSDYQRVGPLTLVPSTLADFGVDAKGVLAGCGLPSDVLDDPNGVVPFRKFGELLEACITATGCEHFGLLLGQKTRERQILWGSMRL
jgi:hypothetical protein